MLCAPGKSTRRDSTKSSKSTKSNLNTASLTISDTSDSLDIESSSQLNTNTQPNHHYQFNSQQSRQRRASEYVHDKRLSFGVAANEGEVKPEWKPAIAQPAFNIIHATPPHSAKETQRIQFTDIITEIPYDLPYEREIAQISSKVQQMSPAIPKTVPRPYETSRTHRTKIPINQERRLLKREENYNERSYDTANEHVYNTIDQIDDQNDQNDKSNTGSSSNRKENTTQLPIAHIHNVYASAGELRVESEELAPTQIERRSSTCRSVGSQTSGFQSGDPSLAYLSAISLRQLQFDQQHKAHLQKSNQLPATTSISGPIVWF